MGQTDTPRIGKYQVLAQVAQGPLAEVLKARLDGIAGFSRHYAIKRVRAEVAADATWTGRIEAEARRAASLAHTNLVQILDLGRDDDDRPYLVLEWVDGWSLRRVLDQAAEEGTSLPVPHVVWIGTQLLKALEYAHGRETPLCHDAVSPSNVLVSRGGEVKLSDFGLGRVADEMGHTVPELVAPRPHRAAPEQLEDAEPSVAADLFAAAAVLYEALTLTHPFRRDTPDATRAALADAAWKPVDALRDDLPDALRDIVTAALSVDPALRPASATDFKNVLLGVLRDQGEVFTQEALARWVRELFGEPVTGWGQSPPTASAELDADALLPDPEAEPPADDLDMDDLHSVHDVKLDLDDDDELPIDKTAPAIEAHPTTSDDPGDDARTEVGGLGSKLPAPAPPPSETWDEHGETRIDPEMAKRIAELRAAKEAGKDDGTRLRTGAVDVVDVAEVARGTAWSTVGIAAIMLAVGIAVGAVGMIAYGRAAGMTVLPPMLEVRTAPDADMTVTVDGQAVTGAQRLTPGPHALTVEIEGATPWSIDLELQPGEYRVFVIEAPELAPAEPPADGDDAAEVPE